MWVVSGTQVPVYQRWRDITHPCIQLLSRYIGSFINGDGGILCFGVRKTGVIYGESITRREEDNIKQLLDDIFKRMHPHVQTDGYRVTFTPVLGSSYYRGDRIKETTKLYVLEIRVAPGDPFSLYEDYNHDVHNLHKCYMCWCSVHSTIYTRIVVTLASSPGFSISLFLFSNAMT